MTDEHVPHQTSAALLPYMLTCTPDPLLVSTEATQATGKLTLMIGATFPPLRNSRLEDSSWSYGPDGTGGGALAPGSAAEVWCQKIVIDIPRGEQPADLARIPDQQTLNTLVVQLPQWNVSRALIGNSVARFTFTPSRGGSVSFNGSNYITAVIDKIPINAEPGTASVTITETTSSTSATAGFADRNAYRDAPKVTADFYFYNLHPREAAIARGEAPVLEWKGNTSNTDFTVYWSDGIELRSEVLQPAAEAWYPRQHIPQNSTTFLVMAEHRPPGQTTTIRRHLTTTVEVIDPDIIANEIRTKGDITIAVGKRLRTDNIARTGNGDIQVADPVAALTVNGDLTVAGDKTVKTNRIGRTAGAGNIKIGDTLDLDYGLSAAGNITAGGNISAAGNISAGGDITVAADRTLKANRIGRTAGSGVIKVGDNLDLDYGLSAAGNITARGKQVIKVGDQIQLEVNSHSKELYLYCETGSKDNVYGGQRRNASGVTYSNTLWRLHLWSSSRSVSDETDAADEPHPAIDGDDIARPTTQGR